MFFLDVQVEKHSVKKTLFIIINISVSEATQRPTVVSDPNSVTYFLESEMSECLLSTTLALVSKCSLKVTEMMANGYEL